ncbi:MAG TPA: hypothetical protein ENF17_06375 [Candidatus Aminicenantes bacterium]|nr:hypothetical protein [Candidatus Aminicenantes bacterium]
MKKLFLILMLTIAFVALFFIVVLGQPRGERENSGLLIYFQGEQVGFEDFSWRQEGETYVLEGEGRLTKPIPMSIERLRIVVDLAYIPQRFEFKGTISGVEQEVESVLNEGEVTNRIKAAGQEQTLTHTIKRDSFLLPNPIFAPYVILAKKYRCQLPNQEKPQEISIYVIPQVEIQGTIQPDETDPCILIIHLGPTEIRLTTNPQGELVSLSVPSQRLEVVRR